jgi:hypothetical protein
MDHKSWDGIRIGLGTPPAEASKPFLLKIIFIHSSSYRDMTGPVATASSLRDGPDCCNKQQGLWPFTDLGLSLRQESRKLAKCFGVEHKPMPSYGGGVIRVRVSGDRAVLGGQAVSVPEENFCRRLVRHEQAPASARQNRTDRRQDAAANPEMRQTV